MWRYPRHDRCSQRHLAARIRTSAIRSTFRTGSDPENWPLHPGYISYLDPTSRGYLSYLDPTATGYISDTHAHTHTHRSDVIYLHLSPDFTFGDQSKAASGHVLSTELGIKDQHKQRNNDYFCVFLLTFCMTSVLWRSDKENGKQIFKEEARGC